MVRACYWSGSPSFWLIITKPHSVEICRLGYLRLPYRLIFEPQRDCSGCPNTLLIKRSTSPVLTLDVCGIRVIANHRLSERLQSIDKRHIQTNSTVSFFNHNVFLLCCIHLNVLRRCRRKNHILKQTELRVCFNICFCCYEANWQTCIYRVQCKKILAFDNVQDTWKRRSLSDAECKWAMVKSTYLPKAVTTSCSNVRRELLKGRQIGPTLLLNWITFCVFTNAMSFSLFRVL